MEIQDRFCVSQYQVILELNVANNKHDATLITPAKPTDD